jgi:multicomponent Na+:H+ antiporter subunit D
MVKFSIVISMVPQVFSGRTIEYTLISVYQGIDIRFRVDALGLTFAVVSSFLWVITTLYSIGYMRAGKEHSQTRFYSCFAISLSATIAVAFSANLITLFVFYEILSLATVPLVGHKEDEEAIEGAKKYFLYLVGASKTLLLAGVIIIFTKTGSTEFTEGGLLKNTAESSLLFVVFFCFLYGFAKGALMPLHNWLPAAMVAPTPVSALLHAVAVVKVGVFSILRVVFHIYGGDMMSRLSLVTPAVYLASFTIIMASVYALTRDNLKARLAYSTISQLSYIILGAVLLTPSAVTGAIFHIAAHAFSKITLFFCAGSIYIVTHKKNVSELSGIGSKMPLTMLAFFIGSLNMIGIPPLSCFVSKWYLVIGSIEADRLPILFVLLSSTLLNAAYFLPIVFKAFFEKPKQVTIGSEASQMQEAPYFVLIPILITAIGSILIGVFPDFFISLAEEVVP